MLFLGTLSVLQIAIIPGWLGLKLAGWRAKSLLQFLVYAFAASLIFNYCFVFLMSGLELYGRTATYALLALEACAGLWLLKRNGFQLRSRFDLADRMRQWSEGFGLKRFAGCLLFGLALTSVLSFSNLFYQSYGSVFTQWDDTVSWDRWAEDWTSDTFPLSGYYPQLMPANWSLSYQIIGTTDVKMFAKAPMLLFPIAALLLFVDMAWRRRSSWLLFATVIYACVVNTFLSGSVIASGYMETALSFFGLLTLYALLELSEDGPTGANVLAASVFAGATALAKQGGVFMVAAAAVWIGVTLYRRRTELAERGELGKLVLLAAVSLILILPWYARQYSAIAVGRDDSNITRLFALAARGKSGHIDTAMAGVKLLYNCRHDFAKPFLWFLLITSVASVADSRGRKVLLIFLLPVFLLWAFLFSYEVRTVSLAFPFIAYCSAFGTAALVRPLAPFWKRPIASGAVGCVLAAACLTAFFVVLHFPGVRTAIFGAWQQDYLNELRSVWALSLLGATLVLLAIWFVGTRRQLPVRINWLYAVPLAAWMYFGITYGRTADIVARQIELQKDIEAPELNRALYAFMRKEGFHGRVATDYWIMGRLPILKQYYAANFYPLNSSIDYLKEVASRPGVCYLLTDNERLSPAAKEALVQGLYRTVLIADRRRLIQTCATPGK